MGKRLRIQRYMPARSASASHGQGSSSTTADPANLAAIMKNNTVLFDSRLVISQVSIEAPVEDDQKQPRD